MSPSVTRNLLTLCVIAGGVSCAALFRKDPDQVSPSPAAWEQPPNSHWQAAAYPDAISLPGVSPTPAVEANHIEPSVLVGRQFDAGDTSLAPQDHSAPPLDSMASAAQPSGAAPSADVKRLPASIGATRLPADPWNAAAEPPAIASQYSEVRPTYETRLRPPPANGARVHIIRDGDSLTALAQKYLGDSRRADEIFELNRALLPGPEMLPIGAELQLPALGNTSGPGELSGGEATTAHGRPRRPIAPGRRETGA